MTSVISSTLASYFAGLYCPVQSKAVAFATHCMKQDQKGKSVYNKLVVLSQVLKQHGNPKFSTPPTGRALLKPCGIYEDSDPTKLFKACAPVEEARFKFYLMSGFRDAEGRFVIRREFDFKHAAVRVTAKPHWGFRPKN
jgi:hypothetical protein